MPHSHLNLAKLRREIFDPEQHSMERMMHPSGDFLSTPELDYEGWRDALRPDWGRYNPEVVEPKTFAGRARPRSLFEFVAMDLSCNAHASLAGKCMALRCVAAWLVLGVLIVFLRPSSTLFDFIPPRLTAD